MDKARLVLQRPALTSKISSDWEKSRFTSLDISDQYLVLGASTSTVYVFPAPSFSRPSLVSLPELRSRVVALSLSPTSDLLCVCTLNGTCAIIKLVKRGEGVVPRLLHFTKFPSPPSTLHWTPVPASLSLSTDEGERETEHALLVGTEGGDVHMVFRARDRAPSSLGSTTLDMLKGRMKDRPAYDVVCVLHSDSTIVQVDVHTGEIEGEGEREAEVEESTEGEREGAEAVPPEGEEGERETGREREREHSLMLVASSLTRPMYCGMRWTDALSLTPPPQPEAEGEGQGEGESAPNTPNPMHGDIRYILDPVQIGTKVHKTARLGACFDRDGRFVFVSRSGRNVFVYDTASLMVSFTLQLKNMVPPASHASKFPLGAYGAFVEAHGDKKPPSFERYLGYPYPLDAEVTPSPVDTSVKLPKDVAQLGVLSSTLSLSRLVPSSSDVQCVVSVSNKDVLILRAQREREVGRTDGAFVNTWEV
ncbi:hypothetical protein KIPB_008081 [Kipferlia bialata]|uniref:Uncharacterized protein n=1 Tax=Kipferlia bialata TaxID=797122 RepID=A0A9K3GKI3_9EUKA|nr:hypothetical protein KIPB_008081 [Kipferlia bialata]|eukprot:g8081.t1